MARKVCSNTSILKILLFLASIATFYYVEAAFAIYDTASCDSCLDDGFVTCRSKHNNSISYCCDPTDPSVANCTSLPGDPNSDNFQICSNEVYPSMTRVVCPFLHETCSNSFAEGQNEIWVSPQENTYTVIGGSLSYDEECYY